MAIIYLRSTDGNDLDDGSTWALAKATLATAAIGALASAAAGDTIYVSQVHAETLGASMALTSLGTAASPVRIICVNDGAEPPTATATTGTITVTGNFQIAFAGFAYVYGLTFSAGTGANTAGRLDWVSTAPWWWRYESCALKVLTTVTSSNRLQVGASSTSADDTALELINTTVELAAAANPPFIIRTRFRWLNTSSTVATLGTAPTTLFSFGGGASPVQGGECIVRNVDLSAVAGTLMDGASGVAGRFSVENCKLHASVTLATASVGQGGVEIDVINCDSGDTNYRYFRQTYGGTISQEIVIVRTGGASDGTTPVSRKMVTTANAKFEFPLVSDPILFWNESLSSQTVTIPVITDNVTLTDAQAWIEVTYLGTSGFPLGVASADRIATILTTPANQTTDGTSTWTTTGLTTPVQQSLAVTFTAAEKGVVAVRVMLARASTTMYYDPKALTGARQFQTLGGYQNQPAAGGGTVAYTWS